MSGTRASRKRPKTRLKPSLNPPREVQHPEVHTRRYTPGEVHTQHGRRVAYTQHGRRVAYIQHGREVYTQHGTEEGYPAWYGRRIPTMVPGIHHPTMVPGIHHPVYTLLYTPGYTHPALLLPLMYAHPLQCTDDDALDSTLENPLGERLSGALFSQRCERRARSLRRVVASLP